MIPLTLTAVIADLDNLPAAPAVMTQLLEYIGRDDADGRTIARMIAQDPVLSAKCLNLANSSVYGLRQRVTTTQDALSVVGQGAIATMVQAMAIASRVRGLQTQDVDLGSFWMHSIFTALCARALAKHTRLAPDAAFLAGLLHDIGKLVLVSRFTGHFALVLARQRSDDSRMVDAERAVLGFTHAEIGAAVADAWKFAPEVARAVAGHHEPEAHPASTLTSLVHVANALAHVLDVVQDENALVPRLSEFSLGRLCLDWPDIKAVLVEVEAQQSEAALLLG